jgi:hypothetical protein
VPPAAILAAVIPSVARRGAAIWTAPDAVPSIRPDRLAGPYLVDDAHRLDHHRRVKHERPDPDLAAPGPHPWPVMASFTRASMVRGHLVWPPSVRGHTAADLHRHRESFAGEDHHGPELGLCRQGAVPDQGQRRRCDLHPSPGHDLTSWPAALTAPNQLAPSHQ